MYVFCGALYCPLNGSGLYEYVLNRQAVSDRYTRTGTLSLAWKPAQVKNCLCVCVRIDQLCSLSLAACMQLCRILVIPRCVPRGINMLIYLEI